jgi:transposase
MSRRTHRQYTAEQKSQYVRLATESGKPVSQVAKELDLTESALRKWIKQAQIDQAAAPGGPLTTEERQELTRLRREVKRLEQERAFLTAGASSRQSRPTHCLKKAAAFFAQETSIPMS